MKKLLSILFLVLLCSSCGGGAPFVADTGPFSGDFVNGNGQSIGAFSFTVINNVLQGTGILNHNGDNITVTISASVNGKVVNGSINNSTFGSGPLFGTFSNASFIEGSFTFTGFAGVNTTTGTWSASVP
ncbi:MAG: hypothetical protein R3F46_13325 [bacterium]